MDANKTQMLNDPNRTQLGAPPSFDPNKTMLGTPPVLNATVTIKPTQCPVCKTFNPAGVMFCVECGLIFDRALDGDAFGAPTVVLPMLVDGNGREQYIRAGVNTVGREGDIVVSDSKVSRRHSQISSENGVITLEDLGSTNGTKLNGTRLQQGERKVLNGGDKISFGGVEMTLSMPGQAGGNTTQVVTSNKTMGMAAPPQREVPPAVLVGEGKEFPLRAGSNTFGRKADNDIQIADPYVSGRHGLIEVEQDGAFLTDTGSTNGTMLNNAKLGPNMRTRLTPEDVIRLGAMEFQVRINPKV